MSEEEGEEMVRAGQKYTHEKVVFEVVEVIPMFDFAGRKMHQISYRIIDGNYVSPVAHLWIRKGQDIRKAVEEVVNQYLTIIKTLRR